MHAEHCHAAIDYFATPGRQVQSDGATAALIDFTEFTNLPRHIIFIENAANFAEKFRIGIIAAGLTARAGILC